MIRKLYHRVRPHAPQFARYLLSGGSAAFTELVSFQLLRLVTVPLRPSALLSSVIGTAAAFFLHRIFVFRSQKAMLGQTVRFIILQSFNALAQMEIVYLLVHSLGSPEWLAKVLGIGATVCWNFFLYKLFVYR